MQSRTTTNRLLCGSFWCSISSGVVNVTNSLLGRWDGYLYVPDPMQLASNDLTLSRERSTLSPIQPTARRSSAAGAA